MNIKVFAIISSLMIVSMIDGMDYRIHPIERSDSNISIAIPEYSKKPHSIAPFNEHFNEYIPVATPVVPANHFASVVPINESLASEVQIVTTTSLYNQELTHIQNTHKKQNGMVRKFTRTVSYKNDADETTVIYNKITGTITYKDKRGRIIKELTKNNNGTSTEVIYSHKIISGDNGHSKDQKTRDETTYLTDNRLGKRTNQYTVTNNTFVDHLDLTVLTSNTTIENYNEDNILTSSMDNDKNITIYPKNPGDDIIVYNADDSRQNLSDPTKQLARRGGMYNRALQQFLSEQVTGTSGSIMNSAKAFML